MTVIEKLKATFWTVFAFAVIFTCAALLGSLFQWADRDGGTWTPTVTNVDRQCVEQGGVACADVALDPPPERWHQP